MTLNIFRVGQFIFLKHKTVLSLFHITPYSTFTLGRKFNDKNEIKYN